MFYLLIFACWFRSVVVITSALHAEGRQFNSGRSHLILFLSYCYFFLVCIYTTLCAGTIYILFQRSELMWYRFS